MLQSKLFYSTLKQAPKETEAISHTLLVRGGYVDQLTAGVYSFLPLGFKVLKKIENIIREEMVKSPVNGQEVLMPALTPKENWEVTGRWGNFDALFKLKGANDKDYALAATHEEIVVPLAQTKSLSYKDLPFSLFQIQTKFRNEMRAKSGLLRTREFAMKDLYSFHTSQEDLDNYYEKTAKAYFSIYKRCAISGGNGQKKLTFKTWASGGSFSKFSHEFQTVTEAGEDIIYVCQKCFSAINREIKDETPNCPNCGASDFAEKKAVEVGNIFKLGTKYSAPFNLTFKDKDGSDKPVIMGCFGLGLGRLLATIVEVNHDDRGIIWPKEVAPFDIHLISLEEKGEGKKVADKIYKELTNEASFVKTSASRGGQENSIEVLYDDRIGKTAGERFAEADLLGIPLRIVVSKRTLEKKSVEIKKRGSNKVELVKITGLKKYIISNI